MKAPERIVLVGSGNVATRLAEVLASNPGYRIVLIASRNIENAKRLAQLTGVGADVTDDFGKVARYHPDIVLVSVADSAVDEVVRAIGALDDNPLILHTSGTLSRSLLEPASSRTAVLYPLQSFTKGREVDILDVPAFTEAESEDDHKKVDALARAISNRVEHTSAQQRKTLHIAGVITNNFTNILLEEVEKLLAGAGYNLDVVRPLARETIAKAFELGPHNAQTGPAKRGDRAVIAQHLQILPEELKNIYSELSELIIKSHNE